MSEETQLHEVQHDMRSQDKIATDERVALADKIVSGQDARGSIVWNATLEAVTNPDRNTHGIFPIVSRQYQELGALLPDLSQPGKTNEAITLIESITEAGGLSGWTVNVELPENATEGERHRALQAKVKEYHEKLPIIVADAQLKRYLDARVEQSLIQREIEGLTLVPGHETSRATARKAVFDYERVNAKIADAEDEMLENTGQWDDRVMDLRVAQQIPSHFGREAVLQAVDTKKQAERTAVQEQAMQKVTSKADELNVVFTRYNIPNDVTGSQAHIILTELPEYVNESISRGYGRNIELVEARFGTLKAELAEAVVPLAQGIEQAGERVDEKIAQAQNLVKNMWQRAVVDNVDRARSGAREVHDRWKAKKEEAFTERERGEIITKRNRYNRVHEREVNRLMKLEEQLVRKWARENGRSTDEVESRLRERREEIAEKKQPNPAQEVFLTMLDSHVNAIAQAPRPERAPQVSDPEATKSVNAVARPTGEEETRETPRVITDANSAVTQVTRRVPVELSRNLPTPAPLDDEATRQVAAARPDISTNLDDLYIDEDATSLNQATVEQRVQEDKERGEAETKRNEAVSEKSPQELFQEVEQDRMELTNAFARWRDAKDAETRNRYAQQLEDILMKAREDVAVLNAPTDEESSLEEVLVRGFLMRQRRFVNLISERFHPPVDGPTTTNFDRDYDRLTREQLDFRNMIVETNTNATV